MLGAHRIALTSRAYVDKLAATYLPKALSSYRTMTLPATSEISAAYERAVDAKADSPAALKGPYASKVGAMIYAPSCSRLDAAYATNMCARCLAFPTVEMDEMADRCIVYMAQTRERGIIYDASAPDASEFWACSDSDWAVNHSTTGFAMCYGGAAIEYSSKRQVSIANSSTEAEIMAASTAACEIMYYRGLLAEMGVDMSKPTVLKVDNSGAVCLSKHMTSCKRSRHIQRRWLKIRELVAEGHIVVEWTPTVDNAADMLTKALAQEPFERHRSVLMGREGD